mmetsp:Transcript_15951/g.38334  ORF Transcript_15951/g.38334 Transcript_15951/m.38334 type:complete len:171 (+) Transcript_15951:80-592(+)
MKSYELNRMASSITKIQSILPASLQPIAITYVFNSMVKLAGTAGIRIESLTQTRATITLPNKRKIQNHIGGLHACSMALAAESATGILIGMNVRDSHLPLIKRMEVDFVRRCEGDIRVEASLSEEDYVRIHEEEKGEVWMPCKVEDESGREPIKARMLWAWVAKQRRSKL